MNSDIFSNLEIKLEPGIVGANPYGAFKAGRFRPDSSFPDRIAVGKYTQVLAAHFRMKNVAIAGAQEVARPQTVAV